MVLDLVLTVIIKVYLGSEAHGKKRIRKIKKKDRCTRKTKKYKTAENNTKIKKRKEVKIR